MWLPLFTNNPVKTLVAVMDIGLQVVQTVCHIPPDTRLDVMVALRFGQTVVIQQGSPNMLRG